MVESWSERCGIDHGYNRMKAALIDEQLLVVPYTIDQIHVFFSD